MAKLVGFHIKKFVIDTACRMKDSVPTILHYSKAELLPPKLSDLPEVKQGISNGLCTLKSGAWKNMTIKEAWLNTVVGIEIAMWFFFGEIIGRRNLKGYHVKL